MQPALRWRAPQDRFLAVTLADWSAKPHLVREVQGTALGLRWLPLARAIAPLDSEDPLLRSSESGARGAQF